MEPETGTIKLRRQPNNNYYASGSLHSRSLIPEELEQLNSILNRLRQIEPGLNFKRLEITLSNINSIPYHVTINSKKFIPTGEETGYFQPLNLDFGYESPWLSDLALELGIRPQRQNQELIKPIFSTSVQPKGEGLTAERIQRLTGSALNTDSYWQVASPGRNLKLSGASTYVARNYPNRQGYDRYVYWPDYRVAGIINDIVNAFLNAGITQVQVGSLYEMSNGKIGCYRRTVPLTVEVVQACAFDPLNPDHQKVFREIQQEKAQQQQFALQQQQFPYSQVTGELLGAGAFGTFPGGVNYQQQAQQARQQIGGELAYLPTQAFPGFPGGQQYLAAQQRNVGQYGMQL